jgi:hypothetical protein
MVFTVEHNVLVDITMDYFRNGFINENGYWEYSRQRKYNQFLVLYPEEEVEYRVFSLHCRRVFDAC